MRDPELQRIFTYHPPRSSQVPRYEALRRKGLEFAELIWDSAPACRERSLAFTAVQQAVMWANAAIAIGESHMEEEKGNDTAT